MSKSRRKDCGVGYGRPPKHSQFKKGVSGNKKGRPKGARNLATLFHEEMNKTVAISENGHRRTITKMQAAVRQLVNSAATGNAKAIQAIMNISKVLGDLSIPDPLQQPKTKVFKLRIFEKDLETGERREVKDSDL
jgi:Family of unknown function (DUF5681)